MQVLGIQELQVSIQKLARDRAVKRMMRIMQPLQQTRGPERHPAVIRTGAYGGSIAGLAGKRCGILFGHRNCGGSGVQERQQQA
jgi:hypothetical protein